MANYKVVEINKSVALKNGDMIAQVPFFKDDYTSGLEKDKGVENGIFFNLLGDKLTLAEGSKQYPIFLHFTEELFYDYNRMLKDFIVKWEEETPIVAYPRALAMYPGDVITTNNYVTFDKSHKFAKINELGQLVSSSTLPTGHAFAAKASTLPDNITFAPELTYLGYLGGE